jgi:hypothetical protein
MKTLSFWKPFSWGMLFLIPLAIDAVVRYSFPFTSSEIEAGSPEDTAGTALFSLVIVSIPLGLATGCCLLLALRRAAGKVQRVIAVAWALILILSLVAASWSYHSLHRRVFGAHQGATAFRFAEADHLEH